MILWSPVRICLLTHFYFIDNKVMSLGKWDNKVMSLGKWVAGYELSMRSAVAGTS